MIDHYTEKDKVGTPVEIISSKVSVYEVELDLNTWEKANTTEIPDFHQTLKKTLPSLYEHKCMPGEPGGFLSEVERGTNFAHVIEHIILELIHLADPEKEVYSGWTREKEKNKFIIHYSAPDFLTGRIAAVLGTDIVKRLIRGEEVKLGGFVNILKQPIKYFTHKEILEESLPELAEPSSLIREIESPTREDIIPEETPSLSEEQKENIRSVLATIHRHINYIVQIWRKFFFDYSGEFGKSIIDKIELINIDKFMDLLIEGNFERFFMGIKNISHVISSYRIPRNFLVHSTWLYKNNLMGYIIEEYEEDKEMLYSTVENFELFFKIILQQVEAGSVSPKAISEVSELQQFRELKELKELKKTRGCILVVDSDEITRIVIRDFLTNQGYRVILAETGSRALAILSETGDEVSLTVIDMVSPSLSKNDIYYQIRQLRPKMNLIISSSFPIDEETRNQLSENRMRFINKPYKLDKLLSKVKSLCR